MISQRYIVYIRYILSQHTSPRLFLQSASMRGTEERRKQRDEERGRRTSSVKGWSVVAALKPVSSGSASAQLRGPRFTRRQAQDQRGEMHMSRGTIFLLMDGEPLRRRSRPPMFYIKRRWSPDSVISGEKTRDVLAILNRRIHSNIREIYSERLCCVRAISQIACTQARLYNNFRALKF